MARTIGYLACTPDIDGPPPDEVGISIDEFRGRLRIAKDGVPWREELSARAALDCLHIHLFESSLADRPRAVIIHAASLRRGKRRVLLVGTKGAGKSTLALRLLEAGYEIEGDEHVFVEGGRTVVRPRGCRIKEDSLRYLSAAAASIVADAPSYRDFYGEDIFNVDPRALGSTWRIVEGTADLIILLRPNHGGFSSIRPVPSSVVVETLMTETGWREGRRSGSIAALAGLASLAKGFDLSLGDHASAVRCIDAAMEAA